MREKLEFAIATAIKSSQPAPSNEPETCFRIIEPLLLAMGYEYQEIKVQGADQAKQKPDYTILPSAEDFTWFLEAKAWDVSLDDNHANQAVNYANTQGKRWVVLSNGKEWRIYDNHIVGTVHTKLACKADLREDGFVSFLEAISKNSIILGKLEGYVKNARLFSYLSEQLAKPTSELLKTIAKSLKSAPGLANVSAQDVFDFFESQKGHSVTLDTKVAPASSNVELNTTPLATSDMAALGTFTSIQVTGRKVQQLILPDGSVHSISTWHELTIQVAAYALTAGKVPNLPVYTSNKSKSPILALVESVEFSTMREPQVLAAPLSHYAVEGHASAASHQHFSTIILERCGIPPSKFNLVLKPS